MSLDCELVQKIENKIISTEVGQNCDISCNFVKQGKVLFCLTTFFCLFLPLLIVRKLCLWRKLLKAFSDCWVLKCPTSKDCS